MASEESLLQAILESPNDDSRRLVYADWLEETGKSERAELIRIQIELARNNSARVRVRELIGREQVLKTKFQHQVVKSIGAGTLETPTFSRGFANLTLDSRHFLKPIFQEKATRLFPQLGILGLRLCCPSGSFELLETAIALSQVAELTVSQDPFEIELAKNLASCAHLTKITSFTLGYQRACAGVIPTIVRAPDLAQLLAFGVDGSVASVAKSDLAEVTQA